MGKRKEIQKYRNQKERQIKSNITGLETGKRKKGRKLMKEQQQQQHKSLVPKKLG